MMPQIEAIINPRTVNSTAFCATAPTPTLPRKQGREFTEPGRSKTLPRLRGGRGPRGRVGAEATGPLAGQQHGGTLSVLEPRFLSVGQAWRKRDNIEIGRASCR